MKASSQKFKPSILAAALTATLSGGVMAQYVDPTTVGGTSTTNGSGGITTNIMQSTIIDVAKLPIGNPGKANGDSQPAASNAYYGTFTQAQETDASGASLLVSGEGVVMLQGWNDGGTATATLLVNGNNTVNGTTITGGLLVSPVTGTQTINFSGNVIKNVGTGVANTDAVNVGQMNTAIDAHVQTSLDTGAGATISGNTVSATNGNFTNIAGTLTGNVSGCVNDGSGGTVCGGTVAGTNGNFTTITSTTINNTGALTQAGTTQINATGGGTTTIGTAGGSLNNIYGRVNTIDATGPGGNIIIGRTDINAISGSNATTIGASSNTGAARLISGTSSIATSNGTNTITGTTNINTTAGANTSIGNASNTVDITGNQVFINTTNAVSLTSIGNSNTAASTAITAGHTTVSATNSGLSIFGNAGSTTGTLTVSGNASLNGAANNIGTNLPSVNTVGNSDINSAVTLTGGASSIVTNNNGINFSVGGTTIANINSSGLTVNGNVTVVPITATSNSLRVLDANNSDAMVFSVSAIDGSMSTTGNATIATDAGTTNSFGSGENSSNTIGNAGTSTNQILGMTNTMAASGDNSSNNIAATGTNSVNNITGTTNINASGTATTNIGTAGGATNLGNASSTNTVLGTTSITGATTINTTGSLLTTLGNTSSTVQILGGTNTIGNLGTSANTMTGNTNAIAATTTNTITGGTGNTITATTGNNDITATAGSNTIAANAASQSNTISATGTNGINNITANATSGVNNIEAKTNNMGVATISSANYIGNAASFNAIKGATSINDSINAATTINTGTSTGNVTMGNALNQTNLNSAYNEIGNSGTYTTVNHIGNGALQSINIIGNGNASSTVNSNGGASYTRLNQVDATMGTGTGGTVRTDATTATIQASLIGSTLASNGSSGQMQVGSGGGYTAYATSQNTGTGTIGNVVNNKLYTNKLSGNTFVDGNVYINGTLDYVSSNSANTSVIGTSSGTSILTNANQATTAGTAIVVKGADGTQTVVDANGKLTNVTGTAAQSTASLTLTNGIGNTHGVVVTETQASLSGGTQSSTLTMADNGGTFSDAQTGGPVQVHGVNDGTSDFDAVNVRQFASAVASVTAMANIPQVDQDKKVAVGMALGSFMGKTAVAAGVTYRFTKNGVIKGSVSSAMNSSNSTAVGVGAAWSY